MSDNKLTDEHGLYQVPDEPDAAPQGSVSQPVSAMGRADAPDVELKPCAHCNGEAWGREWGGTYVITCRHNRIMAPFREWTDRECNISEVFAEIKADAIAAWNRRDGEAARIAEAVAAERARIERELTLLMENTGGLVAWVRTLKVIRGAPAYGTTSAEEYPAQPPGSGDAP
jgi:hypothetical protein